MTEPESPAESGDAARRKLRTRARTWLTVDETVEQIGQTTHDLASALAGFNAALDRFNDSLDRFSDAADELNRVALRLDEIVDKVAPLLNAAMAPFSVARRLLPGRGVRD